MPFMILGIIVGLVGVTLTFGGGILGTPADAGASGWVLMLLGTTMIRVALLELDRNK